MRCFVFDDVIVDNDRKTLLKNGRLVECEPRVFELLIYFCQHPNEAITRESLIENVWHGRVVSDAAVNRAVGELRKLIEESPSSPKYINTVSKVGYQFTITPKITSSQRILPHLPYLKMVLATFIFLILGISYYVMELKSGEKQPVGKSLNVAKRSPITSLVGNAFNAHYDKKQDAVYYLFREGAKDSAQIYKVTQQLAYERVTNDSFYYTDVIVSPGGTIFAARLNNLDERHCEE